MSDVTTTAEMKVQKRSGQVVSYNELRITKAIENAFKDYLNLPREVELPLESIRDVEKVNRRVTTALKERGANKDHLHVEEIQDEVIRQLFENGYKDVAELYANYRKQHAARRSLFELYSIAKRDNKSVSFKSASVAFQNRTGAGPSF